MELPKKLFVVLLALVVLTGVALAKDPPRMMWDPNLEKEFKCPKLGEPFEYHGTTYTILAEATHPETKTLILFFDFTGDCEIDSAASYHLFNGAYHIGDMLYPEYAMEAVAAVESQFGVKILKKADCLKLESKLPGIKLCAPPEGNALDPTMPQASNILEQTFFNGFQIGFFEGIDLAWKVVEYGKKMGIVFKTQEDFNFYVDQVAIEMMKQQNATQ